MLLGGISPKTSLRETLSRPVCIVYGGTPADIPRGIPWSLVRSSRFVPLSLILHRRWRNGCGGGGGEGCLACHTISGNKNHT